jgi:hypothetical protein
LTEGIEMATQIQELGKEDQLSHRGERRVRIPLDKDCAAGCLHTQWLLLLFSRA